jgi:predicted house-cleaning noncanonical NTP pyrophosphatase (MazG superfamily)
MMKYNKLVRDKIPERIVKSGKHPVTHTATESEYWLKLQEKLREEVDEFIKDGNSEELADILEVINAISDYKKISRDELEVLRKKKAEERGAFSSRIILDETK